MNKTRKTYSPDELVGKRVAVYRNLNKNTYSIKSLEKDSYGLVISYSENIVLDSVIPKVSESGRNKVLKEKRKNVHAYLVGFISSEIFTKTTSYEITYDPYKYSSFVKKETFNEWKGAARVNLCIVNDEFKIYCID